MAYYPLTLAQKKIVKASGKEWYGGDDNDFACFLSEIILATFKVNPKKAFDIHEHDPLACECSYAVFCKSMERAIKRQEDMDKAAKAHAKAMAKAG